MSSALWYADFACIHGSKDIYIYMHYSLGAYLGTCLGSLMPRPHPKRVWWIWIVSLVWSAQRACADTAQILDLIGHACSCTQADDSNIIYSRQWRFAFLQLASHIMTTLKLQMRLFHWSAQIPFPGPSKFTRPFSLLEGAWGLGTRLSGMLWI